jgi:hypothetical protein
MYEVVSLITKFLAEKGLEKYLKTIEFKSHKQTVVEHLIRELQLNISIIDEFFPDTTSKKLAPNQISHIFNALKTSAFDSISQSAIPLSKLLEEKNNPEVFSTTNKQYLKLCANDSHLHNLIERTYFRINISKIYVEFPNSKIDIGYLKFLILSSTKALKHSLNKDKSK